MTNGEEISRLSLQRSKIDSYYETLAGLLVWHTYDNEYWVYTTYNGYKIYKRLSSGKPFYISKYDGDPDNHYLKDRPISEPIEKILYIIDYKPRIIDDLLLS